MIKCTQLSATYSLFTVSWVHRSPGAGNTDIMLHVEPCEMASISCHAVTVVFGVMPPDRCSRPGSVP